MYSSVRRELSRNSLAVIIYVESRINYTHEVLLQSSRFVECSFLFLKVPKAYKSIEK